MVHKEALGNQGDRNLPSRGRWLTRHQSVALGDQIRAMLFEHLELGSEVVASFPLNGADGRHLLRREQRMTIRIVGRWFSYAEAVYGGLDVVWGKQEQLREEIFFCTASLSYFCDLKSCCLVVVCLVVAWPR